MSLEIKGNVKVVQEPITGESAKGPWKKQSFEILTEDNYPKKVAFMIWNDKPQIPQVGANVTVSFNAESRDYECKYYTDLTAWKVVTDSEQPPINDTPDLLTTAEDGLPF